MIQDALSHCPGYFYLIFIQGYFGTDQEWYRDGLDSYVETVPLPSAGGAVWPQVWPKRAEKPNQQSSLSGWSERVTSGVADMATLYWWPTALLSRGVKVGSLCISMDNDTWLVPLSYLLKVFPERLKLVIFVNKKTWNSWYCMVIYIYIYFNVKYKLAPSCN